MPECSCGSKMVSLLIFLVGIEHASRCRAAHVQLSPDVSGTWGLIRLATTESPSMLPDTFVFVYWGLLLAVGMLAAGLVALWRTSVQVEPGTVLVAPDTAVDPNLWALNLLAAIGQAKFPNGRPVPAWVVALLSLGLGMLQLTAIALMLGAINPTADPVTKVPSSPWLQHANPWSVNCMKWLMVTVLTIGQIGETAQCRNTAMLTLRVHHSRFNVSRAVPLVAAMMQYLVSVLVIWAAVSIVLSFQSVLDIVYSSMSVFFITSADEMFFEALRSVFDIHSNFDVSGGHVDQESGGTDVVAWTSSAAGAHAAHRHSHGAVPGLFSHTQSHRKSHFLRHHSGSDKSEASDKVEGVSFELEELPAWLWWLLKLLQIFPFFFSFQVIGRAMYTGTMPLNRLHLPGVW